MSTGYRVHCLFSLNMFSMISRYREVVEVPEDSPDAKKWPKVTPSIGPTSTSISSLSSQAVPETSISQAQPNPRTSSQTQQAPLTQQPPKRPPPMKRKPKTLLNTGASSSSTPKPQKLTTLQKSTMDWKAHLRSENNDGLQADGQELQANRQEGGGGYLERMEFLQRVEDRREIVREGSGKRKR